MSRPATMAYNNDYTMNMEGISKLDVVRRALNTNPEVILVKEEMFTPQPAANRGRYIATVSFYVAPRPGCYDQNGLNEFLRSLVPLPHTWPDGMNPFLVLPPMSERAWTKDRSLIIGNLVFEEGVGEQITRITTTYRFADEELRKTAGLEDGVRAITEEHQQPLKRMIFVYAFPDETFVKAALKKKENDREETYLWRDILLADLKPYVKEKTLLQRIFS